MSLIKASYCEKNTCRAKRCLLHFSTLDVQDGGMEGGGAEARKEKEERKGSGMEKRMSYGMSLVWLLLSSSAQWSLPPWESAVWTKPLTEGASGAAADGAQPHLCKLSLINGRRKRRSPEGARKKGGVRSEWYQRKKRGRGARLLLTVSHLC